MKKTFKLKLISLLGLFVCAVMAFAMITFAKPTRSVSALSYASGEFEMLGISIRYSDAEGDDGIRFGVKLKKSIYNELIADNNATAAILVVPYDKIPKDKNDGNRYLDIWTAVESKANARYGTLYNGATGLNQWEVAGDYAYGVVYIHGFPEASFNRPIAARAYIDWENSGNSADVYHSNTVIKSMSEVALTVRTDYEGSNTYGTTASQYNKLDNYLLTYDVDFYDEFWQVSSTQHIKYGNTFSNPSAPTARAGYTLTGWLPRQGTGYASSVFDMANGDKTVKYHTSFKANYAQTSGAKTFEKPALGSWLYGGGGDVTTQSVSSLAVRGAFLLNNSYVAEGSDYLLQATFTRTSSVSEVGFVITTKSASDWNGKVKDLLFVYRNGNADLYLWGANIWHSLGSVSMPAAGVETTMQIVHRGTRFHAFINGTKVVEVDETAKLTDNKVISTALGSGNVKFGLVSLNGVTTFTDWRFVTDSATINALAPDYLGSWLYGSNAGTSQTATQLNIKGAYLLKGAEVANGSDYVLNATFTRQSGAAEMGFVITTQDVATWTANENPRNLFFVYRKTQGDMYFWGNSIWHSLGSVSAPAAGSTFKLQVLHTEGYFFVFINDTYACKVSENATQDGGASPKNAIGTTGNIKFGLVSTNALTTFTSWGYTTDSAAVSALLNNVPEDRILGSWLYGNNNGTTQGTRGNVDLKVKGAYLLKNAEVENGSDYLLDATFTRNADATEMGFVITTNGSWGGNVKNLMFVYRKTQGDMYFWGNGIWHSLGAVTAPSAGSEFHLQIVHKYEKFYVFIGGTKVAEVSENATQDGGASPKSAIGTSGNIKFGLVSLGGLTSFSDWGYTTDAAAIAALVPDYVTLNKPSAGTWQFGGGAQYTVSGGNLALRGAYTINGAAFANDSDFMIQTAFTRSAASEVGVVVTTNNNWNGNLKNFMFVYRKTQGDMYFWGSGIWHSVGAVAAPVEDAKMVLTVIRTNAKFYAYINGAKVAEVSETASLTDGKKISTALGSGDIYLGLVSMNAVTTFNNWTVTNDPTAISSFINATSSRPALGAWQYAAFGSDDGVSGSNLKVKGSYLLNGATVSTGSSYMLTATFTNTGAPELGFVVTTDNNWKGTQKNLWIVRRTSDFYVWGSSIWWNVSSDVSIPASGSNMTLTLVYKSGVYKVFINGALAATMNETTKGLSWNPTMASLLTGSTTYLGLVSTNTQTTFTNWAFSTDATTINYLAG